MTCRIACSSLDSVSGTPQAHKHRAERNVAHLCSPNGRIPMSDRQTILREHVRYGYAQGEGPPKRSIHNKRMHVCTYLLSKFLRAHSSVPICRKSLTWMRACIPASLIPHRPLTLFYTTPSQMYAISSGASLPGRYIRNILNLFIVDTLWPQKMSWIGRFPYYLGEQSITLDLKWCPWVCIESR